MNKKAKASPDFKRALERIKHETSKVLGQSSLTTICEDCKVQTIYIQALQEVGVLIRNHTGSSRKWIWNDKSSYTNANDLTALIKKSPEIIIAQQHIARAKLKTKKANVSIKAKEQPVKKSYQALGTRIVCQDDDSFLKQMPEKLTKAMVDATLPAKPVDGFTFNQLKAMHILLIGNEEIIHYNGMEFKDATLIKFIVGDDETITTIIYFDCGNTSHRMDTLKLQHRVAIIDRTENKFTLSYK